MDNDKSILELILDELKEMRSELKELSKTSIQQQSILEVHVRRTDLAEENLELLRKEIKPIQRHVDHVNGALKLLGFAGILVGVIAGLFQIVQAFL